MRNVINIIAIILVIGKSYGQTSSDKLKKEQQKLEKKISNTKALLNKVKTNSQASLNELKLIDNQIRSREELVRVFDNKTNKVPKKSCWDSEKTNGLNIATSIFNS